MLMVLTSHDRLGDTGRKTGVWLDEFAAPYFVFRGAGVGRTLASPKGEQPPIDPNGALPEDQTPAMTRFEQDTEAQKQLTVQGEPLVNRKRVTGLTSAEAPAVDLTHVVPFLVENELMLAARRAA
jgi:hypothetical protein